MENLENIEKLISLCDEVADSNILFADKKINKMLEIIASTPELYELISDCLTEFDKESEFNKAFTQDEDGNDKFVMPQEQFKVLALVFCLLADIGNGKIGLDELANTYFRDENGRVDITSFDKQVLTPFKSLIEEAFGLKEEQPQEEKPPFSPEQLENLSPEDRLKILPFPIERTSQYFKNKEGIFKTFIAAKETTLQMIERLEEEKHNDVNDDVMMMLHCILIACIDQEFDLLEGLVRGLKYAAKSIKPLKHYVKELTEIIAEQIRRETR